MTDHAANLREFGTLHYVPMTEDERAMILAAADEIERLGRGRDAVLEEAAAHVQHRGVCAVQMINADERVEEKKAYAWDAMQHAISIRALKRSQP